MTTGLLSPVRMHCIQHSRFTKNDGWLLWDLSLSLSGNIAVTGDNENTHRTSIDVYSPVGNSDSRDKPKIFYSKEFDKYENEKWIYQYRCVSFVDSYDDNRGLIVVTGLGGKLEVFDLNQDRVLKSRKVTLANHGWINCLSVREREIFIGFVESNKITVYDVRDLNEIKSIILQGFQETEYPFEMTVLAGRIFIGINNDNTETDKLLIVKENNGELLSQLTYSCESPRYVSSITVSAALGVIALLRVNTFRVTNCSHNQIVFYSLFSPNNSSFVIVDIESGVSRIRICDRGDRMVTMNHVTGEVKVYDMAKIFTYNHLKTSLTSQLQTDDCLRLADFFALPKDQADSTLKSEKPTENFLLTLEEKCLLQPANVDRLAEAFTELKISSSCSSLVDFYQNTRTSAFYKETIQKLQEEINVLQVDKQQTTERLDTAKNRAEVLKLQETLEGTKKHLQETKDLHQRTVRARNTFRAERDEYHLQLSSLRGEFESSKKLQQQMEKSLQQTTELLEKATKEKQALKAELKQSKLHSSMKSMTLEEVAAGGHLTATTKMKSSDVKKASCDRVSSSSTEYLTQSAIEDEFAKLLVKVSVKLTNDYCVMLGTYCNFPQFKIDLIRKDSGTPGLTLLSAMRERNIINMYDVTKLQQALVDVELLEINESLLKPYQSRISPSLYERHKVIKQD